MLSKTLKVLICDDSLLIRKRLKEAILECGNHEVLEAADGVAAIELYAKEKPDVVFMDIVMPNKTGIEALTEIIDGDKNANVVMLSSSGTQTHLKQALKIGAVDFIQKPWEQSHIVSVINKAVMREDGNNV